MDHLLYSPDNIGGGNLVPQNPEEGIQSVTEWLDEQIDKAIANHDIEPVIENIGLIRSVARITGMALVHLLGRLEENWDQFGIDEDPRDYLYAETGLNKATVDRYIKVYQMLKSAPEDVRPQLQKMNVKSLIPIGNAIAQGHVLDEEEWQEVAEATKYDEVANIIRDVKGAKPRKSGMRLWINRSGELYAFSTTEDGEEERRFICVLPVGLDDTIIKKAVERLIRSSGILAEWEV